ncbi:hypothetical protein D3C72_1662080 [compost metagenome]
MHLTVNAQLGHDPSPAHGNGLLNDGKMKDPGMDHFQDIFYRQGRVNPLDFDRWQFAQGQLLVDFMQRVASGTGAGQHHSAPGQLLDPLKTALALAPDQDHGHVVDHRIAGHQATGGGWIEQFTRRHQVGFTAL